MSDAVSDFTCGNRDGAAAIDVYLRTQAWHDDAALLSTVWLVTTSDANAKVDRICAFFTLSPLTISVSSTLLAKISLPETKYPKVGGYLLGRLGVAASFQGQRLGDACIDLALRIAATSSQRTGGSFLAVDPKNDALVRWYEGLGFQRLEPLKRRVVRRLQ